MHMHYANPIEICVCCLLEEILARCEGKLNGLTVIHNGRGISSVRMESGKYCGHFLSDCMDWDQFTQKTIYSFWLIWLRKSEKITVLFLQALHTSTFRQGHPIDVPTGSYRNLPCAGFPFHSEEKASYIWIFMMDKAMANNKIVTKLDNWLCCWPDILLVWHH